MSENKAKSQSAVQREQERRFPLQDGPSVPWRIIEPHERQAQNNHSQSLARLAERGGLGVAEFWFVMNDRDFPRFSEKDEWAEAQTEGLALAQRVNSDAEELAAARLRLREVEQERDALTDELTKLYVESTGHVDTIVTAREIIAAFRESDAEQRSRLAQAGKLAEAARAHICACEQPVHGAQPIGVFRCERCGKCCDAALRTALSDFDKL